MKKSRHCGTWQRNAVAVAVASCFVITSPVYANPIGANVVNGVVSMAQQGNTLNITNSPGAIINWQSFSIGMNEATRFIQQSAASNVLNRVTGVDPSSILGALQSNGRVFLINPNGVLFGAGAQVDVAGLVVSTLNLSNADFLAGRYNFTANAGAGGIDNQGNLTALPGGQIYLVAPNLSNSGLITSPNGDIVLAAGNSVELVNASSPDMRVVISAPSNQAINLGSIVANSGRVGIYAGLINHHGIVSADTATVGATGKIIFKATRDINLEPGSVVSAKGGGRIEVLGGMQDGQLHVGGMLDASAPDGGDGGFIETSAAHVRITDTAHITTAAPHGKAGMWLIDPNDFTIALAGDMTGAALGSALGLSNVTILSDNGATLGNGDIFVDDAVGWSANNTLTLTAVRNIDVHANIIATGATSGITLTAGGMVTVQPTGAYDVTVSTPGNIVVTAGGLTVQGGSASASWGSPSAAANATLSAGGNTTLTLGAGGLTVRGGSASASASGSTLAATANATVHAGGILTIDTTGAILVQGGSVLATASSYCSTSAIATAKADAELSAGGLLKIVNATGLTVQGGNGAFASATGSSANTATATATANATVQAGTMDINLSGPLTVQGGSNASANANCWGGGCSQNTATAHADALISATGVLTINNATSLTVEGGNRAFASATGSGNSYIASATATANATVHAATVGITTSGAVQVKGGYSPSCDCSQGAKANGSNASNASASALSNAELSASGSLTIDSTGGVTVAGGGFGIASPGDYGAIAVASGGSGAAHATVQNDALLSAGATLTITNATGLTIAGGNNTYASASGSGSNTAIASTKATVQAGSMDITLAGPLTLQGGNTFTTTAGNGVLLSTATASAWILANTAPGEIIATVAGDMMLTGGNAAGTEAKIFSYGPIDLTIGGATGLSLTGTSGAATGIFPDYNQPLSPITITFTGGGSVQPFSVAAGWDARIESLYVVPPPPPPAGAPSEEVLQPVINTVLDSVLEITEEVSPFLLAALEPAAEEEGPLEKKPTYTCQ